LKTAAAQYLGDDGQTGKKFRPTIVALIGLALAPLGTRSEQIVQRQLRLGQVTEMIHSASLVHDDVLDDADTRRGGDAVHVKYGNKIAVLAGDYMLAKASVALARLQQPQVVEVMSSALQSLVEGEVMQATASKSDLTDMRSYLRKSYYKTASLIACACKSAALLQGFSEQDLITVAMHEFGYHLGMAYQIIDDILDFNGASAVLGKPAQADMKLGLATAPVLYAAERDRSLKQLIERKFKQDGDIQKAVRIAKDTDCLERSYRLAEFHAQKGVESLMQLPQSSARDALLVLMHKVIARKK
jgi:geranylgeranyl pyrophosphate synthase